MGRKTGLDRLSFNRPASNVVAKNGRLAASEMHDSTDCASVVAWLPSLRGGGFITDLHGRRTRPLYEVRVGLTSRAHPRVNSET